MKMDSNLYAFVWATLAAGIASNPLRHRTTGQIAEITDELVAEYEKRHEARFPERQGGIRDAL
jgi:hypothetical protein